MKIDILPLVSIILSLIAHDAPGQGGSALDYERALSLDKRTRDKVFHAGVTAHWLPDGTHFWYRVQTGPQRQELVLVDALTGARKTGRTTRDLSQPPADPRKTSRDGSREVHPSEPGGDAVHVSFVNALADEVELWWVDPAGKARSYGKVKPGADLDQNTYLGHVWRIDAGGKLLAVVSAQEEGEQIIIDGPPPPSPKRGVSPDGRWQAWAEGREVHLRAMPDGLARVLASASGAGESFQGIFWSPDSARVATVLVRSGQDHPVTLVESSPKDQLQPKVQTRQYLKPGDRLPEPRPMLIDISSGKTTIIDTSLCPNFFTETGRLDLRWSPDGREFFFDYNQRGHQLYRIIGVDAVTGRTRTVVEETSRTFIDYTHKTWRHWLAKTGELLWMSERDGWCHLWLYDVASGRVKNQVTSGQWVVRNVEHVDEDRREIWFIASGLRPGEDPYHQHLCRVGMDGKGLVRLTEGDGNHKIAFSPGRRFFIDTWSRTDLAPVSELRRAEDGVLVAELEKADASELLAAGWTMPERFTAKGRDGRTDIYGVIVKPSHMDAARRYPIVEEVYAGPHGAFVPKDFDRLVREHSLAELGFVVVRADGMGTNHRGKAFHDVCWKNLKDAGSPDRIAWIRAAARTRPWMDLAHVGIFGGSAGGQSAMRALLDHHDFYSVAVADCGCHDNRMDKVWWNEQWMGWPVDDSYARSSNVVDAGKLQGRLMLGVGELDTNVDPATTMQVVNALEKAGKDFDLVFMTGEGHGCLETPYGSRRRMDFLVRHLLNVEPRWQP